MEAEYQLMRKYRPKSLAEVIGQPSVTRILTNAMTAKRLKTAYLFEGIFGGGKTSLARVLAAMENCESGPTLTPCGTCYHCERIFTGKHVDILEIDAASGAGSVDATRLLKAEASFNPVDGARVKYFIIDEIHACSNAAIYSLLKILEEPPTGVRFVLATTDAQKLSGAIQSRCQKHTIKRVYWSQISEHLENIAKKENISHESGVMALCAKAADGSVRNALQFLEKLTDYAGGKTLTVADAETVFGSLDDVLYARLIDCAVGTDKDAKPDALEGYKLINQIVTTGVDPSIILRGIEEHLRCLMVVCTCSAADLSSLSQNAKMHLKTQREKCKDKVLKVEDCRRELNEVKKALEYNFGMEAALFGWLVKSVHLLRT